MKYETKAQTKNHQEEEQQTAAHHKNSEKDETDLETKHAGTYGRFPLPHRGHRRETYTLLVINSGLHQLLTSMEERAKSSLLTLFWFVGGGLDGRRTSGPM
jgi:hypothetical protein